MYHSLSLVRHFAKRSRQKKAQVAILRFLADLENHPFKADTSRDPREENAYYRLRRMVSFSQAFDNIPPHPASELLSSLLRVGDPYHAKIDIRSITAVSASKGKLVGELDSLPETMSFDDSYPPNYGPFDEEQTARLREAILREFNPSATRNREIFDVTDVTWSHERIAGNCGASRRFSLWRRLAGREGWRTVWLNARITPVYLDEDGFTDLLSSWRIVRVNRSRTLERSLWDMRQGWPDGPCPLDYAPAWQPDRPETWIIPLPHRAPDALRETLIRVHAAIDRAGIEDVLRSISEARCLKIIGGAQGENDLPLDVT